MSEDEYGYQEDFDENEMQEAYPPRTGDREEDDEQHAQKLNGKLEGLQQQVDTLRQELDQERRTSLEMRQHYENELQLAWKNSSDEKQGSSSDRSKSSEDVEKFKRKCQVLEEKLEMALLTNSGVEKLPIQLEEAFHKFCDIHSLYPDHKERFLTVAECMNILKLSMDGAKRKKKVSSVDFSSAPTSAEGSGLRSTNTVNRLSERVRNLEEDLRIAEAAAKDADSMKSKLFQASDRIRIEKELKRALELELQATKKKVEMLGDHIEKLVVHIKREGAQKVRLAEQLRTSEKEAMKSKDKMDYVQKKSAAKDRLILELREGSKVLEDQLRLMDEKYLELRGKLDFARAMAARKIKKAEKTAADLRIKFAMTGSPIVLDALPMPAVYGGSGGGGGYYAGEEAYENEDHGWGPEYGQSHSAVLPPKKSNSVRGLNSKGKNQKHVSLETMSVGSTFSLRSEPTLDGVLDKIKNQTGDKGDWTEEKAKLLAKSR